ncbi:MAG: hypothetical protein MUF48_01505 [Pirellulaceae bacterium]|nr:hypothetical protein [Pirellulaceae bacterium]
MRRVWSDLIVPVSPAPRGAVLTRGMPSAGDRIARWLGSRWIWWPRGIPSGERLGVVSSRLGAPDRLGGRWFALLRHVCAEARLAGQVLLTVQHTALAAQLERCAELLHVPLILARLPRSDQAFDAWLRDCLNPQDSRTQHGAWCWPAYVSPPQGAAAPTEVAPARDALLLAASQRVLALRVRRGGQVLRLLERRLAEEPRSAEPRVTVVTGSDFVSARVARTLVMQGAAAREYAPDGAPSAASAQRGALAAPTQSSQFCTPAELPRGAFLNHSTRGVHGPWPDQSRDDYLDSLILGRNEAVHTPLATLRRILLERRLRATSRAIRGGTPVVCFTAAELTELGQLRTFRAHRRRWDFEPYGISIAQSWLVAHGARPVVYGDESCWRQLPDEQRPFFQRRLSGQRSEIDWSREREWRHPGDVDLAELGADDAFVFVPGREEARQLAAVSRWRIVVLA